MAACKTCGAVDDEVRRHRLGYAHPGLCYNILRAVSGDERVWVRNPDAGSDDRELRGTGYRTSVRVTR